MRVRLLDRYVGKQFVFSWVVWLVFMVGLMIIFDFFANMDDFAEAAEKLPQFSIPRVVLEYYLVNSVFVFLQIAPFITVTAAMFTVARMVKYNEVVPMVVTGTSIYRILVPIFLGAAAATVLMVGIRELTLPSLRPLKERLHQIAFEGEAERVKQNLFYLDPSGKLVSIDKYYSISRKAKGVSLFSLGKLSGDWERIMAAEAVWVGRRKPGAKGFWRLVGGRRMGPGPAGEIRISPIDRLSKKELDPDFLAKEIKKTREFFDFSYSELAELARLRPDFKNYQVLLHYHVTFPLANILLLLLTLPFGFNFERRSTLEGVIQAIMICGLYMVLDIAMRNLGGTKVLNPVVSAWIVPIVFGSAGVVLFGSIRT